MCPNANVRINPDVFPTIADHPFAAMRDAGLLVSLNTDDPALVDLTLTDEYLITADAFGYDWEDLVAIALGAVDSTWLDDAEKTGTARRVREGAAAAIEKEWRN